MIDYIVNYKFKKEERVAEKFYVTAKDKKHAFMKFQNACMRLIHRTVIVINVIEDI